MGERGGRDTGKGGGSEGELYGAVFEGDAENEECVKTSLSYFRIFRVTIREYCS